MVFVLTRLSDLVLDRLFREISSGRETVILSCRPDVSRQVSAFGLSAFDVFPENTDENERNARFYREFMSGEADIFSPKTFKDTGLDIGSVMNIDRLRLFWQPNDVLDALLEEMSLDHVYYSLDYYAPETYAVLKHVKRVTMIKTHPIFTPEFMRIWSSMPPCDVVVSTDREKSVLSGIFERRGGTVTSAGIQKQRPKSQRDKDTQLTAIHFTAKYDHLLLTLMRQNKGAPFNILCATETDERYAKQLAEATECRVWLLTEGQVIRDASVLIMLGELNEALYWKAPEDCLIQVLTPFGLCETVGLFDDVEYTRLLD